MVLSIIAGVSAAKQICSARLLLNESSDLAERRAALNDCLPPEIRVFDIVKVTRAFNAKRFCGARTYGYYMPSFALAHVDEKTGDDFR